MHGWKNESHMTLAKYIKICFLPELKILDKTQSLKKKSAVEALQITIKFHILHITVVCSFPACQ